jgi:4-diphosphocytidyl-2C-methyl-D-erythritol kinase
MITLKAWAKVNIGLRIIGKRDDGFHNIETTLSTINLADIITFEQTESDIKIEAIGIEIAPEKNLCYLAADVFKKKFGLNKGVCIKLTKNIPIGGGLGGGSADAACVLKGINKLFELNVPDNELLEASREIGTDVPETDIIVEEQKGKKKKAKPSFKVVNDFEKVVFKKHPDLLDVKTNLLVNGAYIVTLSGSGSCMFVVVDDKIRKGVLKYLDGIGAQYFEVVTI